ncbi:hypothetical protein IBL26_03050 [Roseomonas aerophila]|uniref:Uncharacterized protein n=1 Tax=Teichococcus aerophilus TaxID=1224513 RepID=A0ABR7RGX3_9PROT|nr:hypothetical protein [Pseudoroseomonas aerophila]MBC9205800.1 hypothetical protein [Pseudoroseomonas aerophila]
MRKYLTLLVLSLVALFWVLPTLLELRQADKAWLDWMPDTDAELWTYVRLALELLAIVAGLMVLRQAWKQFWRALAD